MRSHIDILSMRISSVLQAKKIISRHVRKLFFTKKSERFTTPLTVFLSTQCELSHHSGAIEVELGHIHERISSQSWFDCSPLHRQHLRH